MSEIIVGIDLGTTNSEIAVWRDGRPVVLADDAGRLILPSVVGLADDGTLLVGEEARNQAALHPERTIRSIKRRMGKPEPVRLGERDYAPQEISGMILRRLKETAEARLGEPIRKAVITVPAYFSDAQRHATREAGVIAGLVPVRILNEPTAAALTYEAGHKGGKRVVVYDLGGGTFDVSVVHVQDGVVEVVSSHGNNFLGGDDFDAKLVGHIVDHLKLKHNVDPTADPRAMARILHAAETAKRALSEHPFVTIEEEYLTLDDGKPVNLSLELARDDYEAMIEPYIAETLDAVHVALKDAGLTVAAIDEVLLVGGATRTPLVRRQLEAIFGQAPHGEVDPDLCVALGAAIQAAAVAGTAVSAVLVDVTPYSFGIGVLGELDGELYPYRFAPIVPKNAPIPVRRSEVFFTSHDDQERVEIKVYQGENPDALENEKIGEFSVVGLKAAPAGSPIVVDLALDRDGILQVTAREKATGLERKVVIDKAARRFEGEGMAAAKRRVGAFFAEEEEAEEDDEPSLAAANDDGQDDGALVARAQAKLEEAGDEDRAELVDLIEALGDARAANDAAALATARDALKDLLFYLDA